MASSRAYLSPGREHGFVSGHAFRRAAKGLLKSPSGAATIAPRYQPHSAS